MAEFTSRAALVNAMRAQISGSDKQALKALLRIHAEQTKAEQFDKATNCYNGVGFTKADARILSSMADWAKTHGGLTPKQLAVVKRKIPKYAGQLVALSLKTGLIVKVGDKFAYGAEVPRNRVEPH